MVCFRTVAFDKDDGENARVTYSLKDDEDNEGHFSINDVTGEIFALKDINPGDYFEIVVSIIITLIFPRTVLGRVQPRLIVCVCVCVSVCQSGTT